MFIDNNDHIKNMERDIKQFMDVIVTSGKITKVANNYLTPSHYFVSPKLNKLQYNRCQFVIDFYQEKIFYVAELMQDDFSFRVVGSGEEDWEVLYSGYHDLQILSKQISAQY
jgi:hypothetical protein